MKKLLLCLCASSMLSSFSIKAFAQTEDETLFFFGFEDGLASLKDSSVPIDSVTEIRYFNGTPGDGTNKLPSSFDIAYVKDTLLMLYNGITPYAPREDSYEIIEDLLGSHQAELQELGAQGGNYYLKYTSGGEGSSLCDDYRANLFIRGVKFEEETSYRLVFYTKASDPEANLQAGIYRGYFSCEKPISLNGSSGNQFLINKTEFTTDRWERNTLMIFYQNDSVANTNMYNNGYWWSNTWKTTDPETGKEYDKIQQFDKYYLRLSFRYPGRTYYVDDISLYKSTIGGAEYNSDILRVNFGYETNLPELTGKDQTGAIELPGDYFTLTAEYGGEPYSLDVLAAEYHSDGYLYIWLDNDSFDGLENVRLSFKNPKDPALQIKYTGALYPNSLDTAWVNAGRIVPDFENEFAVFNPEVSAVSKIFMAPVVVNSIPENGSFNLDPETQSIKIRYSKKVYVNATGGTSDEYNPILSLKTGNGREIWTPSAYDDENYTVTFSRPKSATTKLSGDCDFEVINARSDKGDMYLVSQPTTITLSFGDVSQLGEPNFIYDSEQLWASDSNGSIPKGWTACDSDHGSDGEIGTGETPATGGSELIYFGAGGAFTRGFYLCPRGGSDDAVFTYGANEGYGISLNEGNYWLTFKAIGWSNIPTVYVYVYPMGEERPETPLGKYSPENAVDWQVGSTGSYVVTEETEYRYSFTVDNAGSYIMEFVILSSDNWGWGASVIGSLVLSNQYSAAFKYIKMLTDAQSSADAILTKANSETIYSGEYLNGFSNAIKLYEGFTSTSPSDYENATQAIKNAMSDMNGRISTVDKFYSEYKAAQEKEATYTDSVGYNQLVAYTGLVAKIAEYEGLDVTVLDNDALKAITAEVTAATQAMTDRCSTMDKFNGLKNDLENLFVEYSSYDFTAEFQNAQAAYNKDKDLDLITATDDILSDAITSLDDAKTTLNNKMVAATILTKQDKALMGLAADQDVQVDQAIEDAMKVILDDRQDIANIYQLAIKARLSEIMASGNLEEEIDMTGYIQNPSFYTTYSPNTSQLYNNEDPLPGWTILKGSGNVYLRRPGSSTNRNLKDEGSASDAGIAVDWNGSIKLTQTIKNLPAGKYTLSEVCSDKGWGNVKYISGGLFIIQMNDNGDTLSVDTLHGYAPDAIQFTALGGDVQLLHDYTTTNTWAFIDDMQLTLNQALEGFDYSSAANSAKESLDEALLNVTDIIEPDDTRYYNLNGLRTEHPEGIIIRISTGKNGSRKTERVFIR